MTVLPKSVNQRIGRALHTYSMLGCNDRLMVAVSGGVDSLFLSWLLTFWRKKAPIDYQILAVHIDNGFSKDSGDKVAGQLDRLGIDFRIEKTGYGPRAEKMEGGRSVCYHCARQRRNHLFGLARELGINKIAFGHHRDDLLETFFLNLLFSGNLSTMVPHQKLFRGRLSIIRPLALVDKEEIVAMARKLGIEPVKNPCPHDNRSRRQDARRLVEQLAAMDPRTKANMFHALGNVRPDYLLDPGLHHADRT